MNISIFFGLILVASHAFTQETGAQETRTQEVQDTIVGVGIAKTEMRRVDDFNQVRVHGSAELEIVVGDTQQLVLTTDANLLDKITTEVVDGELTIGWEPNKHISTEIGLNVTLHVPELKRLSVTGSAGATITNAAGSDLAFDFSGSGNVKAAGDVKNLAISIKGSAQLDLENVTSQNATVKIMGSGKVLVNANASLDVSIAGSGAVQYVGQPTVRKSLAGSGSLSRKETDKERR